MRPSHSIVPTGPRAVTGAPAAAGPQVNRVAALATGMYWYTVADCQFLLMCSRATVFRLLPLVPPADKVKVKRFISPTRITTYWRISPAGLKIMGHRTGRATYL